MGLDKSSNSRIPTPPETRFVSHAAAPLTGSNAFAVELWARLRQAKQGNAIASPAPLAAALTMAWHGARGETAAELKRVLHLDGPPEEIVSSAGLLQHSWNALVGRAVLRVANRLFGEKDFSFGGSYLETTQATFGTPLGLVGFKAAPESARAQINTWVARQTDSRVPQLVPEGGVDASTRLVLVNALSLEAEWDTPFKKKQTRAEPFFDTKDSQKIVAMMHGVDHYPFAAMEGVKVLELPFEGGDLTLVLVLPDSVDGLGVVEQGLTSARLERWLGALKPQRTNVSLPRFEIIPAGALVLNDVLKALGVQRAFDPADADLTGIAMTGNPGDKLYLSRVFQHASLRIDERGARTATSGPGAQPFAPGIRVSTEKNQEFRADHPFLFLLRDKRSGMILLMGRVSEPELAPQDMATAPGVGAAATVPGQGAARAAALARGLVAGPPGLPPDTEPEPFGRYELLRKLANGSISELWLALSREGGPFPRTVAIKRFHPDLSKEPEFVDKLAEEVRLAARLRHPNIAEIYEFGQADGSCYVAMEYVHGEDLGRVLRKAAGAGQWISRHLALRIIANACEGLYHAHTRKDELGRPLQVVHRDLTPQSIVLSFEGPVKLVDFGYVKDAAQAVSFGDIEANFNYMPPELAAGKELDARADIFSLGMVLYELLTGVLPFKRGSELATLQAVMECQIQPPSKVADVPPELDAVVMNALARAPDDRYRDARQFQRALEELLVAQGWVASSVEIAELMEALFAEGSGEG